VPPPGHAGAVRRGDARDIRPARTALGKLNGARLADRVKILVYDGQGFWACHKRLSTGKFSWWPAGTAPGHELQACELQVLLMAGDASAARTAPAWRALNAAG